MFADPRQRADRAPSLPVRDPVCQHRSHPRPGSHSRGNAEAERLHDGALREMAPGHPDQRPGGRPGAPSRSGRVRTRVRFQSATCNKTADSSLPERSIGSSGTAPGVWNPALPRPFRTVARPRSLRGRNDRSEKVGIEEIWTDSTAFAVDQFLRRRLLDSGKWLMNGFAARIVCHRSHLSGFPW